MLKLCFGNQHWFGHFWQWHKCSCWGCGTIAGTSATCFQSTNNGLSNVTICQPLQCQDTDDKGALLRESLSGWRDIAAVVGVASNCSIAPTNSLLGNPGGRLFAEDRHKLRTKPSSVVNGLSGTNNAASTPSSVKFPSQRALCLLLPLTAIFLEMTTRTRTQSFQRQYCPQPWSLAHCSLMRTTTTMIKVCLVALHQQMRPLPLNQKAVWTISS